MELADAKYSELDSAIRDVLTVGQPIAEHRLPAASEQVTSAIPHRPETR